jgi:hypothetical protein
MSSLKMVETRVVDPDSFITDPDPAFLLNPDPDPDPQAKTELSKTIFFLKFYLNQNLSQIKSKKFIKIVFKHS